MEVETKKLTLEEILKAIEGLTDEEKAQVAQKVQEPVTPEKVDETPEEIPEEKEESFEEPTKEKEDVVPEVTPEEKEEIPEETPEELSKEKEEEETPVIPEEKPTEEPKANVVPQVEEKPVVPETPAQDTVANDNKDEIIKGLTDRVAALEEANKAAQTALEEMKELKALMEQYTQKQAANFGYKGQIPGIKKDIKDMSADELKNHILQGK